MNWWLRPGQENPDEDPTPFEKKGATTGFIVIFGTMFALALLNFGLVFLMMKKKRGRRNK